MTWPVAIVASTFMICVTVFITALAVKGMSVRSK